MNYARHALACALAGLALLALLPGGAAGQDAKGAAPQAGTVTAPPAPPVVMPGTEKIVVLLRTTMLTLNDALQTGNFTVLRDKAAPAFREANSSARLSNAFRDLLRPSTDLSVVAVIMPQLDAPPALDPKTNMLHLRGHFSGQSDVRLNFDVVYQPIEGHWRLFTLAVQPAVSPAAAAPASGANANKISPAIAPRGKMVDQPRK